MKTRILFTALLLFGAINSFGQRYEIIGKGSDGSQSCSGYISQSGDSSIKIHISDMLEKTFKVIKRQVDEKTIKYSISDFFEKGTITKYQTSSGSDIYYFTFPPLYSGQGYTTYKTRRMTVGGTNNTTKSSSILKTEYGLDIKPFDERIKDKEKRNK